MCSLASGIVSVSQGWRAAKPESVQPWIGGGGGGGSGGVGRTLRLRRPRFCCCCCCSMSSMAVAGGDAALMARTTLMLSSGSGGRFSCRRLRTFISWSSSKPPRVNWGRKGQGGVVVVNGPVNGRRRGNGLTSMVFQSSSRTFFMGKWGAFMLQNLVTMVKRSRAKGSPLYRGEAEGQKGHVKVTPGPGRGRGRGRRARTQLAPERLPGHLPLRPVVLRPDPDGLHHQVHDAQEHPARTETTVSAVTTAQREEAFPRRHVNPSPPVFSFQSGDEAQGPVIRRERGRPCVRQGEFFIFLFRFISLSGMDE